MKTSTSILQKYRFRYTTNAVILTLYLFLIVFVYVYVFVTDNGIYLCILSPILALILWIMANTVLTRIERISIAKCEGKKRLFCYLAATLGSFIILMLWFIAYKPGSYQGDCLTQFHQALTGKYNDWHPAWQTFLTYTIPLTITGGKSWAPTFFQMVAFSASMGYIILTVYEFAGAGWATGIFLYVMLNPYTGQMLLYPWKDCPFAMTGGLVMAMAVRIYFLQGEWTSSIWHTLLLGIILANCTLFRHNAILYTAVIMIGLLFHMPRKRWCVMLAAFVMTMILIKGPFYRILEVEHVPQSVTQTVVFPMTVIGNVVKETPELLDDETREFVYSLATQEIWERDYQTGCFGVMEYYGEIDLDPIEEMGPLPIVKMMFRCIHNSPKAAFKAVFSLSDIVYGLDQLDEGYIGAQIQPNNDGIVNSGNESLAEALLVYYKLVRLHGYNFLRQFAFSLLALMGVLLGKCDLRSAVDWKRIMLCMGILTYSFGTMLLLTTADSRFFYVDYLVCPLAIIILLSNPGYTGTDTYRQEIS